MVYERYIYEILIESLKSYGHVLSKLIMAELNANQITHTLLGLSDRSGGRDVYAFI